MAQQEKFATLHKAARIWAVAAIHADRDRLQRLHAELYRRLMPDDRLVYLGNMIGLAVTARETVNEILTFRRAVLSRPHVFAYDIAYLRGAQEEMWRKLLQLQFAPNPAEVLTWMLDHGLAGTLQSYGGNATEGLRAARDGARAITRWTLGLTSAMQNCRGHYPFMSILRRAASNDVGTILCVHAGLDPEKPLGAQGDSLWWGRAGFDRFDQAYGNFRRIIRGHDSAHPGLLVGQTAISVDGGCGYGGPLLAVCVEADTGQVADVIEI